MPETESGSAPPSPDPWAAIMAAPSEPAADLGDDVAPSSLFAQAPAPAAKRRRGRPKTRPATERAEPIPAASAAQPLTGEAQEQLPGSEAINVIPSAAVPQLWLDASEVLQRPPKRGRLTPSPLLAAAAAAHIMVSNPGASLDAGMLTVADFFLDPKKYHVVSNVAAEQQLQLTFGSLRGKAERLAACLLLLQQHHRRKLEEGLANTLTSDSLLFYLDVATYDETPLKVSVKEPLLSSASAASSVGSLEAMPATAGHTSLISPSQTMICKLLQTRSAACMLLKLAQGQVAICTPDFCPLQSMSKANAAVLSESLARNSGITPEAERFRWKLRALCVDKAGYNRLGEEHLQEERGSSWSFSLFTCDVHAIAGCHNRTFEELVPEDISGVLRLALCLRFQDALTSFRQSLLEVIMDRGVSILPGQCSQQALACKAHLLTLILEGDPQAVQSMVVLLGTLNGDWRRRGVLLHHHSNADGPPPDQAVLCRQYADALIQAALRKKTESVASSPLDWVSRSIAPLGCA